MKNAILAAAVLMLFSPTAFCEDEYSNSKYGIRVRVGGDWQIVSAAKLEIDLRELSDEQLAELFQAYHLFGVVRLAAADERKLPFVEVDFVALGKEPKTAQELAESYERGAESRGEEILVSATEADMSGVRAARLVTKLTRGRSVLSHQFFVRRARSYVVVTGVLPDASEPEEVAEVLRIIDEIEIDVDADKPVQE